MKDEVKNLSNLSDEELILFYSKWLDELKKRELIRTKNILGDLGEYLAVQYYNKNARLPNLQLTPPSTQSIDAISNNGDRYAIKTITGKTTGVFYGVQENERLFEYAIVVVMNKDYTLNKIIELTWENFLKHKHWHSRMEAWNLTLSKKLIDDSKMIYSCD